MPAAIQTTASDNNPPMDSFDAMNLRPALLRGILASGADRPSAIQSLAIPPIIAGTNTTIHSPSGPSKTAALAIAALQLIDDSIMTQLQALILVPTREVAGLIYHAIRSLAAFTDVKCCVCAGGGSIHDDINKLRGGPQVVVGTPGRVAHLVHDAYLNVDKVKMLVVDEVDELCAMGFEHQVFDTFSRLRDPQVILSSPMGDMMAEWEKRMMVEPIAHITLNETASMAARHLYIQFGDKPELKTATLCDFYQHATVVHSVVFCNARSTADMVVTALRGAQIAAAVMDGSLDAQDRTRLLTEFRTGILRALVAVGHVGSALDFKHVVNFDLPASVETYVQRAERVGRFGRKGVVVNFVTEKEMEVVRQIESKLGVRVERLPRDFASLFH